MWLYIPTSCPSAQGLAGLNSACCSDLTISERLAAACVTWRGKPRQPRAWLQAWKRGGFIRRLSGVTLEPLTAQAGVDAWISLLQETRARATALPESGWASWMTAGCSTGPSTYSTRRGLILSSARTCRGTRTDKSPLPFRHWSDWAAALRAEYSARLKPATRCGGSDCSSWPSERWPAPNMGRGQSLRSGQNPELRRAGRHQVNLEDVAEHWAAPRCNDPEKRGEIANDARNGLPGQAEHWAGPAAQNFKGSSQGSIRRRDGQSRADLLHYQAEQFFRIPASVGQSSPDQPIIAGGAICSTDGPNINQPLAKRKLNPIFVEALMRWPTGLSGFARQETAWTRWWQLMPSYLSCLLCTQSDQMGLFE